MQVARNKSQLTMRRDNNLEIPTLLLTGMMRVLQLVDDLQHPCLLLITIVLTSSNGRHTVALMASGSEWLIKRREPLPFRTCA